MRARCETCGNVGHVFVTDDGDDEWSSEYVDYRHAIAAAGFWADEYDEDDDEYDGAITCGAWVLSSKFPGAATGYTCHSTDVTRIDDG
jgi:hypothetical protein